MSFINLRSARSFVHESRFHRVFNVFRACYRPPENKVISWLKLLRISSFEALLIWNVPRFHKSVFCEFHWLANIRALSAWTRVRARCNQDSGNIINNSREGIFFNMLNLPWLKFRSHDHWALVFGVLHFISDNFWRCLSYLRSVTNYLFSFHCCLLCLVWVFKFRLSGSWTIVSILDEDLIAWKHWLIDVISWIHFMREFSI